MAFRIRSPLSKESLQRLKENFPEADPQAIDLTVRWRICSHDLEELMIYHLNQHDLTPARFSTLMLLYKSPERRAKPIEMAELLGVTRGNMTGVLDNLERDGLICRNDDPEDRRINYICLTEKGLKLLTKMLPAHFERMRKLIQPLNKQERETFLLCLEKLQASIKTLKEKS